MDGLQWKTLLQWMIWGKHLGIASFMESFGVSDVSIFLGKKHDLFGFSAVNLVNSKPPSAQLGTEKSMRFLWGKVLCTGSREVNGLA